MYHANYLRYMEHARTDYLRRAGHSSQSMMDQFQVVFAVTESWVKYIAPAKLSDQIEITAVPQEVGPIKVEFEQEVWLTDGTQSRVKILAQGRVKVACLDAISFKPKKIPEEIMRCMGEH